MKIIEINGNVYMFIEDVKVFIFDSSRGEWLHCCNPPEVKTS